MDYFVDTLMEVVLAKDMGNHMRMPMKGMMIEAMKAAIKEMKELKEI
jgi:hypothetical protein